MTLYDHTSDDGFVSMQESANLFVAGAWQVEEAGFHPKYGLAIHQSEQDVEDGDKNDGVEDERPSSTDALTLKIAEAYSQGYLNGQQAIVVQLDESQERQNALAEAINRLKPVDDAKLAKQLWEAVLSLFQQAVGNATIDTELMQQQCEAALKSIEADLGEACLYVAPRDAGILQDYDCAIPVVADPKLLPGSVRLAYRSGQITSGSLSMVQAIEARTRLDGGVSC